jgi:hypothetical protein
LPAVGTIRGITVCRACLDVLATEHVKPFMKGGDPAPEQGRRPEARAWEEWRHRVPAPVEEQHEPMQLSPVPPSASPTTLGPERPRDHGDREGIRRGRNPRPAREQQPGTERHSPAPEVVYVPVVPASPAPTPDAPGEPAPRRRVEPEASVPAGITHLVEPGALPEARKLQPEDQPTPEESSSRPEEKASKPEEPSFNPPHAFEQPEGSATEPGEPSKRPRRKMKVFNGAGGRIHTEKQIEEILDWYLQTGALPTYVSDRQRWSYRHHRTLPERRRLLEQRGIHLVIHEVGRQQTNVV